METQLVQIDSLTPDPGNARKHGRRNLDVIRASLARFGQQAPLVVDADNVVLKGNGTLAAAKELGWREIAVVRSALTGDDAAAFAVVDNRAAELAEWDPDVLALTAELPDVGDLGFTAAELTALSPAEPVASPNGNAGLATPAPDARPKPGKPVNLTAEQRAGVDEAFSRFRDLHGSDGMPLSEGQIVTLIIADWMAGDGRVSLGLASGG